MILFWLLACASTPDVDADGAPDNADCAPDNPLVAPSAAEVCNGVDDDCDGEIDEGLAVTAWYRDGDGDGHGAPSAAEEGCQPAEGYAAVGDDCDDEDPWAFPGAVEICDGVDQDCDGAGDDGAVDATLWYADTDGDGFGDAATETLACDPGAGWAAESGDCDDTRANVSPAGVEVCGGEGAQGVDEDCDGQVDAEDPDVQGASVAYPDADGDGWGGDAAVTCDRTPESAPPCDCDDADPTSYPGAAVSCDDDADHDCDGRPDAYDGDGDGAAGCVDCDDADDDVYPGAS